MYIIIYLIFLFFSNFLLIFSKLSSEQITCISDYLLINKNIQTILFTEKINKEWKIQRGISIKLIKNIKINKNEMINLMNIEYTNNCFELNKKFIKKNKNTLIDELIVKKILNKIKKKYLILSENYQNKLEEQSFCLANLLLKMYGTEFIKIINLFNKKYKFDLIKNYYKIYFNQIPLLIYWDFNKFWESNKFNAIDELNYYNDIKLCFESLINEKFNPLQLFFNNNPFSISTNIVINQNIIENDEHNNCIICLTKFEEGEEGQLLTKCNVIYFIKNISSCPICRTRVIIEQDSSIENKQNEINNQQNNEGQIEERSFSNRFLGLLRNSFRI
ncbi:hypothetical protein Mgra_00009387 [Meloidogyne graminicola]|uniref:Uncharacterized protein n=1 Tax=Meloidogyne graminicola TaxID=189291 RepID=A0A8S9ZC06_9BILA|nr:hypothetical protein Mgra_00009387 [Meloidogyne graminicola]